MLSAHAGAQQTEAATAFEDPTFAPRSEKLAMTTQWFIVRDGKEQGPFGPHQLKEMALREEIVRDNLVRRDDMPTPMPAMDFDGLVPEWYILRLSDQEGPFTSAELESMVLRGEVYEENLLRRFDWLEWQMAGSLRGVKSLLSLKADRAHELEPNYLWYMLRNPFVDPLAGDLLAYPTAQIKDILRKGELRPDDLVNHPEDQTPVWKFARSVPFFDEERLLESYPSYKAIQEFKKVAIALPTDFPPPLSSGDSWLRWSLPTRRPIS